ncbi:hypothetical protein Q4555_12235 [Octadecabacter sp. 1_MG-2023]|uniref:hypothetical protein n=1 Tax=unclassified Octadecabacter TaxID=196158 RepID=UPI001C099B59|nr:MULTISPECIES: hypothetical protein [unclassified Octadecabacter]MBU2993717.1 hypothetical protein [Octadecabacter sp. B2R22]MDO6735439.1 hypothetical protein [Octadecabacter sp. 1_MG-2023]
MTATPDPCHFVEAAVSPQLKPYGRPQVSEVYWGYETKMNEQVIDLSVLARGVVSIFAVAAFIAAVAVWIMPAMSFTGSAFLAKLFISLGALVVGAFCGRHAFRGTRVRVQIDTNVGELRQVIKGATGGEITLSRHGLDTVKSVDVVSSRGDSSFGQVQITLTSRMVLAVADGAVATLYPLRDRLAHDCGIIQGGTARPAVWTGPLAA